jgi:hypothetical protein
VRHNSTYIPRARKCVLSEAKTDWLMLSRNYLKILRYLSDWFLYCIPGTFRDQLREKYVIGS